MSAELTKVERDRSKSRVGWRTIMSWQWKHWNELPTHHVLLLQTVHNERLQTKESHKVHKQDNDCVSVCSLTEW